MLILGQEPMKESTRYTFKYHSDSDSIDLNTLLTSQIHFGTILSEIKNEIAGDTDLSIRIKPLEKGNVPFDIILNVSWLKQLLQPDNIAYASGIITVLVGLFQIRMWLKGEKPTSIEIEDEKIIIKKGDLVLTVPKKTYLIYERNTTIDIAMKKGFEAIEKDEEVTSIEIQDEKKVPLITVPRENFEDFISPNELFESLVKKEPVRQETLTIFKVVFDKGYKWQFYMNGRKISASIPDNFMDRIDKGERFAKGDTLVAEVEVEKVYDKTLDIYVEKDFKILNVIEHKPRAEQGKLDL